MRGPHGRSKVRTGPGRAAVAVSAPEAEHDGDDRGEDVHLPCGEDA
ncbi:hypothetical protein [Actinoallomurus acaciae]|uniref:Uncharacterized protein n=1 Tax=Actinoallomurus acaciae TaxID=502577 RepID=A0ABV5YZN3_9ACTN